MPDSLPDGIGWCIADKHKKAVQALGHSLRSLFEQLARRIRQLRCLFRNIWSEFSDMWRLFGHQRWQIRQPALLSKLRSSAQGLLRLLSATAAKSISEVKPSNKRGAHHFFAFSGDLDEKTAISLPRRATRL